eukprot:4751216-Amphidinium_carterae.1
MDLPVRRMRYVEATSRHHLPLLLLPQPFYLTTPIIHFGMTLPGTIIPESGSASDRTFYFHTIRTSTQHERQDSLDCGFGYLINLELVLSWMVSLLSCDIVGCFDREDGMTRTTIVITTLSTTPQHNHAPSLIHPTLLHPSHLVPHKQNKTTTNKPQQKSMKTA